MNAGKTPTDHRYTAFISYNSKDDRWARWLQNRLERYSMPTILAGDDGKVLRTFESSPGHFTIFRYKSDLVTVSLSQGLRSELDVSNYLIVICSPNSARSEWVGREINHFIKIGRKDKIIPFVVSGTPYSGGDDECYHPILRDAFPKGDVIGVQVNDTGDDPIFLRRRKAVAKTVSLLLDTPGAYTYIWNRYRRQLVRHNILRAVAVVLALALMFLGIRLSMPFDATVTAVEEGEEHPYLAPLEGVQATFYLDDDVRQMILSEESVLAHIPRRYRHKPLRCIATARYFLPVDTLVIVGKNISIPMRRDEAAFGHIEFNLWKDDSPV
ncbi:MAG: toll/interleukin-1 receptor domain-containing protein, partial [Bacteroidales bacterium]|nr:toll/interleukin-1 receptor domain-containing protein [Bacteroidales bacterium]